MSLILAALAALIAPALPSCPTEDATATVCTWDATEQGNEAGSSFVVIGSHVIYLPTAR